MAPEPLVPPEPPKQPGQPDQPFLLCDPRPQQHNDLDSRIEATDNHEFSLMLPVPNESTANEADEADKAKEANEPEVSWTQKITDSMKNYKLCWLAVLLTLLVLGPGIWRIWTKWGPAVSPDPPDPQSSITNYYDQPKKRIFSIQPVLESASDTTSGVKGQLRLCSEGKCCETESFLFAAPTMIYPNESNSNCTNFIVHNKTITIEVLNEDVEKVQVDEVRAVLEDGATLKAKPAICKPGMWCHKTEMEFFEPDPESWGYISIEVRYDEHTVEQSYYNGTHISVRVPNDTRPYCTTNPLSGYLTATNGVKDLESVREMGTCFTYNITNKNNQPQPVVPVVEVKYYQPKGVPFKVKEIKLKSLHPRTNCWRVKIKEPSNMWLKTEFNEAC